MAKTTKRPRLNADKVKSLYRSTKSITLVAEKIGASYAGVRNNLIAQGVLRIAGRKASRKASRKS